MELSNNKLSGENLEILSKKCPNIYKLKLDFNEIKSIDNLKCLSKLEKLNKISVKGNPFTESNANYQKELYEMIETLESIDSHNKKGEEVESSIYEEEKENEDEENENDELGEDEDEGEEYVDDGEEDEEYGDDGDNDGEDEDDDDDDERPHKKK